MPRVLIIDDSRFQRVLARGVLEDQFDVIEAGDGDTGLELARSEAPDCILLDYLMPGTSGSDVLRTLKDEGSSIPVVVVTADEQQTTRDECLELGAALVIEKPRDSAAWLEAVEAVLKPNSG